MIVGTEAPVNREIYLDNNATTKPLAEVVSAMVDVLGAGFGNPSSAHAAGERARDVLRVARCRVARLLGGDPNRIVFTSSGTEANNMALRAGAPRGSAREHRIVTTGAEHSSILKVVDHFRWLGADVVAVPISRDGIVDLDRLATEITPETTLVSVQWVNSETGVIQPIRTIGELCRSRGVRFHTDACQAVGKMALGVAEMPVDLLTATAHKLHGPLGTGALYVVDPALVEPLLHGGPQEDNLRAGTENLPGISGFGKAAEARLQQFDTAVEKLGRLRDLFEERVRDFVPDVSVNGDPSRRVCNTTNLCFHGVDGQALVARLDQEGIRCSQSSACTSQRPEPSYVLRGMGLSEEEAYSSVRFGFGVFNTEQDVEAAAVALRDLCSELRIFAGQLHEPIQDARM